MKDDSLNNILYILYMCVLGCCCITPTLYYLRAYRNHRQRVRRIRELDHAGMMAALHHSQRHANQRHERNTVRTERLARIAQLMEPVKMTLKEEHFKETSKELSSAVPEQPLSPLPLNNNNTVAADDPTATQPSLSSEQQQHDPELGKASETFSDMTSVSSTNSALEDQAGIVIIPKPGLSLNEQGDAAMAMVETTREAPAYCTICLSGFLPGSEIVWSSNETCEHVFHQSCMEEWLTKQSEGPLCPCCRRDFLVDPYDFTATATDHDDDDGVNHNELGLGVSADVAHVFAAATTTPTNTSFDVYHDDDVSTDDDRVLGDFAIDLSMEEESSLVEHDIESASDEESYTAVVPDSPMLDV